MSKPLLMLSTGLLYSALALTSQSTLAATSAPEIKVVASFSILADVVRQVGGSHVQVTSLVPANGDPHEFEPSPADAKALKEARVTFLSGEGLENWFSRLAKASGSNQQPVVVSDGLTTHTFEEDGKQVTDPHVWNSIPNVLHWVSHIEQALAKADPADAADYKANAERYSAQLKTLDGQIRAELGTIPVDKRKVLTSHDAFGYYSLEYGVSFLSPLGLSTETEASASEVAQLIEQIRQDGIKVYFFENSNDPRLIRQIADATGAQPGGELYPESLSDAAGPAPSYLKMMSYNTEQILKALKP
ncbi:metal ABC transporter solute-binding protein, Zn/Mn family [Pokkaliibacter plantistimulans]|nr:zinc ABC transporter substrate-binding protein [Pokkaliibacter plantistimulans]